MKLTNKWKIIRIVFLNKMIIKVNLLMIENLHDQKNQELV